MQRAAEMQRNSLLHFGKSPTLTKMSLSLNNSQGTLANQTPQGTYFNKSTFEVERQLDREPLCSSVQITRSELNEDEFNEGPSILGSNDQEHNFGSGQNTSHEHHVRILEQGTPTVGKNSILIVENELTQSMKASTSRLDCIPFEKTKSSKIARQIDQLHVEHR